MSGLSPILDYAALFGPPIVVEPPPTPGGEEITNVKYYTDITSLRDDPTSLEAKITSNLDLLTLAWFIEGGLQFFRLETGDYDAGNPELSVRPLDYNATTNNKHWQKWGVT